MLNGSVVLDHKDNPVRDIPSLEFKLSEDQNRIIPVQHLQHREVSRIPDRPTPMKTITLILTLKKSFLTKRIRPLVHGLSSRKATAAIPLENASSGLVSGETHRTVILQNNPNDNPDSHESGESWTGRF